MTGRVLKAKDSVLELGDQTLLMGIVNVTPDSFSDGGKYFAVEQAVEHALTLLDEGAHIIDIGGESTRPDAVLVSEEEETARIIPVIEGVLRAAPSAVISVDTWKSGVASAALAAGAKIINDITGLFGSKDMAAVIARQGAAAILMHNPLLYLPENKIRGKFPKFPTQAGLSLKLIEELRSLDLSAANILYLKTAIERALHAGIDPESIVIDPGLGFGISTADSLSLLHSLKEMTELGCPLLIGASRKRFVKNLLIDYLDDQIDQDMIEDGTGAVTVYVILNGADIVRVHDIRKQRNFVAIADAIREHKAVIAGD